MALFIIGEFFAILTLVLSILAIGAINADKPERLPKWAKKPMILGFSILALLALYTIRLGVLIIIGITPAK